MKLSFYLSFFVCLLYACSCFAQSNFSEGYEKANPAPAASTLSLEEKVKMHEDFLAAAVGRKDVLSQLYGNLFLFVDYGRAQDYEKANHYLLEAEGIAISSGNPGWQGAVSRRKSILPIQFQDYKAAIPHLEKAVSLCGTAGDSLCVGESLEQLSTMYGQLGDFKKAQHYFDLALPLIQKFGKETQLGITLNNFGMRLALQGRPAEAIPYFQRAAGIYHKKGLYKEEGKTSNNLADAYTRLRRFDQAIQTYRECILFNKEHQQGDNLIMNYMGLSVLYDTMGNYQLSNEFLIKHYALKDSLIGAQTKLKIADLETKYKSQEKELALQKAQMQLSTTQRTLERGAGFILLMLLLIGLGLWRWKTQSHAIQRERVQSQEALDVLTRILLEKNTRLAALEEQISEDSEGQESSTSESGVFDENLYDQRILTNEDWVSFKVYFERAYPGYLLRLRTSHPSLSDAEERLFLFIKLNLTTREAAAILGISAESVKKTRQRLRQRLNLSQEAVLEAYVRAF
jgi:tetratricopeptide (TPR) repeat protein